MFMAGALGELIVKYFNRHLSLYLALIILFIAGLAGGAVATQKLSGEQKADLTNYLGSVYTALHKGNAADSPRGEIVYRGILDNILKTSGLLFVLGLSVIGSPLILGVVFLRGFVLGFTIGFLVQDAVINGLIISTTSILPHNLLIVPALLVSAAGSLSFASTAFRKLLGLSKESIYGQFASTTFLSLCSSIMLVLAALIEIYLTPIFIHLTSGYLI